MFDKLIEIQRQNPDTEEWELFTTAHATVNKAVASSSFVAGADQFDVTLNFDVRYTKKLNTMRYSTQPFRIVYEKQFFKIVDYDDYFERHQTIRLRGVQYG
ncbi:MAG: phage head closure protein [Acutalibacteraceae bacterium]